MRLVAQLRQGTSRLIGTVRAGACITSWSSTHGAWRLQLCRRRPGTMGERDGMPCAASSSIGRPPSTSRCRLGCCSPPSAETTPETPTPGSWSWQTCSHNSRHGLRGLGCHSQDSHHEGVAGAVQDAGGVAGGSELHPRGAAGPRQDALPAALRRRRHRPACDWRHGRPGCPGLPGGLLDVRGCRSHCRAVSGRVRIGRGCRSRCRRPGRCRCECRCRRRRMTAAAG